MRKLSGAQQQTNTSTMAISMRLVLRLLAICTSLWDEGGTRGASPPAPDPPPWGSCGDALDSPPSWGLAPPGGGSRGRVEPLGDRELADIARDT